jgi:hypothetical protein
MEGSPVKRLTYLQKREDQTTAEFRDYWRGTHASIAARTIPATAYRQHLVLHRRRATPERAFCVSGVVELTFDDPERFAATFGSSLGDRLEADERNFLSGFSGASIIGETPSVPPAATVWILSRGHRDDELLHATRLAAEAEPALLQERVPYGTLLTRSSLLAIDDYPAQAVEIPTRSLERARQIFAILSEDRSIADCELLVAEMFAVL